jgi:GNAT superfamily N-acetyltransferase
VGASAVPATPLVTLAVATEVSDDLRAMWERALADVLALRGGAELVATLHEDVPSADTLSYIVAQRALDVEVREGRVIGFAVRRDDVIAALYVEPARRGEGIARSMVNALLARAEPARDAWALPGDRATKSLYESLGWKARLLTMRAAE